MHRYCRYWMAAGLAAGLLFPVVAARAADEAPAPADGSGLNEIQQRIEAVERDRAALERGAAALDQQRETLEELRDLVATAAERVEEAEAELADLAEKLRDDPACASCGSRKELLARRLELDRKIVAVKDPADLPRAREWQDQVETLNEEWELVRAPGFEIADRIAEMEERLREENATPAQREAFEEYRRLAREDEAARRKELEAATARRARSARMNDLLDRFWRAE